MATNRRDQECARNLLNAASIKSSAIRNALAAKSVWYQAQRRRMLGNPAPYGREVLVSEAMRPANATGQWHRQLGLPGVVTQISLGMTNLAVVEAANPEMEALAIAVAMREARHLNKSVALVTPDRALARRVMGRFTAESDIQQFRRRSADRHVGRDFRANHNGNSRETAGAADPAGTLETSIVPAGRSTRRFPERRRDARASAFARNAATGGERRACTRLRPLSR